MRIVDSLVALVTVLLGGWIAWTAGGYGYTSGPGPGPGFFPFWIGSGLALMGAVNLYRSVVRLEVLAEGFEIVPSAKALGITGIIAAFVFAAPVLGMIPGAAVLILAIGFVISPTLERGFVLRLLALAVVFPLATWLLFSVYLGIRLVDGKLGF